eukprot:TRINITY_DN3292_c0_g1_i1.p1 TRINITY_DN3292_c0_g1~~TRINITY_DN3292_c0_g1_i1.p1  ORF type:complete len:302 (-),score=69.94 TRINITY_DN3292_c0_g1_i1:41-838(-)
MDAFLNFFGSLFTRGPLHALADSIYGYIVNANSSLSRSQRSQLNIMVHNLVSLLGTTDIGRILALLQAIVTIASMPSLSSSVSEDHLDTESDSSSSVFGSITSAVREFFGFGAESDTKGKPKKIYDEKTYFDVEGIDAEEHLKDFKRRLKKVGVKKKFSEKIPVAVLPWLLSALEEPNLICPITLEPILGKNGKLVKDIVAVVQRQDRAHEHGMESQEGSETSTHTIFHVFLYNRKALYEWFEAGDESNPLTRTHVERYQIIQLS